MRGQPGLRDPAGPDQQLVDPGAVSELGDVAGGPLQHPQELGGAVAPGEVLC